MKCVDKTEVNINPIYFCFGCLFASFFEILALLFCWGTQKRSSVKNPNKGLKTTLVAPFHNAGKGQKRTLFRYLNFVTGYTVGLTISLLFSSLPFHMGGGLHDPIEVIFSASSLSGAVSCSPASAA